MNQPAVLTEQGDQVCGRYLKKHYEVPLAEGLCTTPPVVRVSNAMHSPSWAAVCRAHCEELISKRPDWVAKVTPLNDWGDSDLSRELDGKLQTLKQATAGVVF